MKNINTFSPEEKNTIENQKISHKLSQLFGLKQEVELGNISNNTKNEIANVLESSENIKMDSVEYQLSEMFGVKDEISSLASNDSEPNNVISLDSNESEPNNVISLASVMSDLEEDYRMYA